MKILILVLSYTKWPFDKFMQLQQISWDTPHNDVDVVYYYGGNKGWHGKELSVNCSDAYEMMHWKFKLALDAIDYHEYDFIFRTNSCSYIVKDRLIKEAYNLPRTACYAGWLNGWPDNVGALPYISGAGIFFSPDVLAILQEELTDTPHGAEDVLIGQILLGKVAPTARNLRIDADVEGFCRFDSYHFRAKTSNDVRDRVRDIDSLKRLHRRLNG